MKNKLTIACLSLICSFSLASVASCSDSKIPQLSEQNGLYLTYNGTKYDFDELYGEYDGTMTQAKAYYDALNDIFIQIAVDTTALIENDINDKVDSFYETAKDNAKTNGTSEKEEIEKAFNSENVKNEEELRQKYSLEIKTTENNKTFESDKTLLTYRNDYVEKTSPYVTKHILVKVDASSSNLYDGKISEDNAYKLSNVITGLASNTTYKNFGEVAQRLSDDSSASSYGLISAPMEISTSFVNEYKLGLYAQDYLFNSKVADSTMSKDRKNLVERTSMPVEPSDKNENLTVQEVLGNQGRRVDVGDSLTADTNYAFGIPVSAALNLAKFASVTKSKNDTKVKDATEINYPRNIIFNHYFNNRGISYIYLDEDNTDTQTAMTSGTIDGSKFVSIDSINLVEYTDTGSGDNISTGLKNVGKKKILVDERNNPILVTRAGTSGDSGYEGIHFITYNFNPFESVNDRVTTPAPENKKYDYTKVFENLTTDEEKVKAVRSDYFNLTIPSLSTTDTTIYNPSLITSITASESRYYNTLAEAVRTALKNTYGTHLDFKKFETNMATAISKGATLDDNIKKIVQSYIDATVADSAFSQERSLSDSWLNYLRLVDLQESLSSRILPNSCINEFYETGKITEGGVCDATK